MISGFNGQYRFLSNYYPANVEFEGITYRTVEHAYQAAKSTDPVVRQQFLQVFSPGDAKRLGQHITKRHDWEDVKLSIMKRLLQKKFYDGQLATMLKMTGEEELMEGNYWHDNFWGRCTCNDCQHNSLGLNHLGLLLMEVRTELVNARSIV